MRCLMQRTAKVEASVEPSDETRRCIQPNREETCKGMRHLGREVHPQGKGRRKQLKLGKWLPLSLWKLKRESLSGSAWQRGDKQTYGAGGTAELHFLPQADKKSNRVCAKSRSNRAPAVILIGAKRMAKSTLQSEMGKRERGKGERDL